MATKLVPAKSHLAVYLTQPELIALQNKARLAHLSTSEYVRTKLIEIGVLKSLDSTQPDFTHLFDTTDDE